MLGLDFYGACCIPIWLVIGNYNNGTSAIGLSLTDNYAADASGAIWGIKSVYS